MKDYFTSASLCFTQADCYCEPIIKIIIFLLLVLLMYNLHMYMSKLSFTFKGCTLYKALCTYMPKCILNSIEMLLKLSYLRYSLSCMQWFYRYYFLLFLRIILPTFFLYWVIKFCHLVTKKKRVLVTIQRFSFGGSLGWHKVTIFFQRSFEIAKFRL